MTLLRLFELVGWVLWNRLAIFRYEEGSTIVLVDLVEVMVFLFGVFF